MTVISVYEDSHGFLCVAKDYQSAVKWLIGSNWLDDTVDVCDNDTDEWHSVKEMLGEDWADTIVEKWDVRNFNDFFDGCFRLEEIDVVGS